MKKRPRFLLTWVTGIVALAVVVAPVLADELIGVLTKVDAAGKNVTVEEKGTDKEVVVKITDDTEYVSGKGTSGKFDFEKISKGLAKAKDNGKKGVPVTVTHDKGVASKIAATPKKKDAN
jgi:hypothetical protein